MAWSIDLIVEDSAQEAILRALVLRLCHEAGKVAEVQTISGFGGRPRVLSELKLYLHSLELQRRAVPDCAVVGSDGNCSGFVDRRNEVTRVLHEPYSGRFVCAIPDPHVESWFFSEQQAFHAAIGPLAKMPPRRKCDKAFYKRFLKEAIAAAGHQSTLGGSEFADELVSALNLPRATQNCRSLKHFVDNFRALMVA